MLYNVILISCIFGALCRVCKLTSTNISQCTLVKIIYNTYNINGNVLNKSTCETVLGDNFDTLYL